MVRRSSAAGRRPGARLPPRVAGAVPRASRRLGRTMTTTAASPLLDRSWPERLSSLLRWANPVRAARRPSQEMTHRLAAAIIEQRSLLAALPAEPGHDALRSELRRSLDL